MESEEQKFRNSSGFTFVTVAPKGNASENPTMRRLRAIQDVEKAAYEGASTTFCGRPGTGINMPRQISPELAILEEKCRQTLQELSQGGDFRPLLITFSPVSENQLVRNGPPQNSYMKGSFLNHKELLYRVFKTDARLVRSVLENTGFSHTDSHDWNIMWLGTSAQQYLYEGLNEYQRINHFPSSFEVTRKDKLSMNILNMQSKHGKDVYDFIPETFVLPDEFADFYSAYHEDKRSRWIVKPSCSSQGRGIYLVDSINEVPMDENCIISKYIQNPLLINGLKFDLRIYVLVSSFEPLRVYVYDEGLARFASETYNPDSRKNRFSHLTNYSVNKKNDKFVQNQDYNADDVGHKWSISALFKYLASAGVDTDYLWSRIYDLVIKTILSIESIVVDAARRVALHRNNCFDLFGFDVIIDSNLKPWLLEVNLSPSLATESPLDMHIKGNLIADTFNLLGLRLFDRKRENMNKVKARIRARQNQINHANSKPNPLSIKPMQRREKDVSHTQKMKEVLKETLEEYERKGNFIRIYPSQGCESYDPYFSVLRSFNMGLYKALFVDIMNKDLNPAPPPLPIAPPEKVVQEEEVKEEQSLKCSKCSVDIAEGTLCTQCKVPPKEGKLVITGDDILMEYISRLMHAIKAIREDSLKIQWRRSIEKFICHYVWHSNDMPNLQLWERLDSRIHEMKERQKRLVSAIPKRKSNVRRSEEQKQIVIRGFSASQLESMLCSSTKNIAQEVVACLISSEGRGVLTDIIKWLAASAANNSRNVSDQPSQKSIQRRPYTSGKN